MDYNAWLRDLTCLIKLFVTTYKVKNRGKEDSKHQIKIDDM